MVNKRRSRGKFLSLSLSLYIYIYIYIYIDFVFTNMCIVNLDQTLLLQAFRDDIKVDIPQMIKWEETKLPEEWELIHEMPPTQIYIYIYIYFFFIIIIIFHSVFFLWVIYMSHKAWVVAGCVFD